MQKEYKHAPKGVVRFVLCHLLLLLLLLRLLLLRLLLLLPQGVVQ